MLERALLRQSEQGKMTGETSGDENLTKTNIKKGV
jgi:hypothetical protein